jgi:putative nucleotidyltransferase with HDIG domain
MRTPALKERLFWIARFAVIAGCTALLVPLARPQEWHPVGLVVLLVALAMVGQWLQLTIRGQPLTAGFIPIALAMALLGPVAAVAITTLMHGVNSARRRVPLSDWLTNLTGSLAFPLAGASIVIAVAGDVHASDNIQFTRGVSFALLVFGVSMVANALNFAIVAIDVRITSGMRLASQARDQFIPLLPSQIATAALASVLAWAYTNLGLSVLLATVLVLLIFQYLTIALLRSEDRADQLEARSIHLASLQVGVLSTLLETLALRDRSTARHAAAVARYARDLAREVGCTEEEQELAHTVGLLHDIGKFALPDRVLHATVLSDDDWDLIRRHPQDGAALVGRLDGYGEAAEAILYHHENVDGSGYPAGLIGNEIPTASRIVAVCSTYDTLTARDNYRSSKTPQDAMSEMRRVAGRQLDTGLVEAFIGMIQRDGFSTATHDDDSLAAELAFPTRARKIAQLGLG